MQKIIAFKTLDGASFWVKNAKKKNLLTYRRVNENALISSSSSSSSIIVSDRLSKKKKKKKKKVVLFS